MNLSVKRIGHHSLPTPRRATEGAVGFDLCAVSHAKIASGQRALVGTGFAWAIPAGFAGLIWPRSGLALRLGLDRLAGVIDPDYRGEVKALLLNTGSEEVVIEPGDRIAQLLIVPVLTPGTVEVKDLPDTLRGAGGFGHTGK